MSLIESSKNYGSDLAEKAHFFRRWFEITACSVIERIATGSPHIDSYATLAAANSNQETPTLIDKCRKVHVSEISKFDPQSPSETIQVDNKLFCFCENESGECVLIYSRSINPEEKLIIEVDGMDYSANLLIPLIKYT